MAPSRMILCLGPPGSGTSTVTAALGLWGRELALPDAHVEGAEGVFEQPEVVAFDERLLAVLGGAWDAAAFDCKAALASSPDARALTDEAAALVRRLYGSARLAAMADPQLCRLLPFWVPVLRQAGFADLTFVHVLCDPAEVAVQRPDPPGPDRTLPERAALWLSASCRMWQEFPAARHVMIAQDRLIDAPGDVLADLSRALDLTPDAEALARVQADPPDLRRSRVTEADRAAVAAALPQAALAFAQLMPLADGRLLTEADVAPITALWEAADTKDAVARIMAAAPARVAGEHDTDPGNPSANELLAQIDLLRAELALQGGALARKAAEVEALHASASWRFSAPIRAFGTLAHRTNAQVRRSWTGLNHFARRVHRGLFARSPRLAEAIRVLAAPVLHRGNRAILQRVYVPAARNMPALSLDQPGALFAYQEPKPPAPFAPRVTVLVPNFNHAPYLRQRLDSVFGQTYPNIEVLLMDDASRDDSRRVLTEYADRFPDKARVIFNDTNSGGAFHQWEKGIRAATGQLIWIAESDDWCDANFLETLVPFFANDGVQMAYAPSIFMNEAGTEQTWTLWDYLADLGPDRWRAPFVLPAPVIVREAFAARNIIPNASSAIFRRPDPDRLGALDAEVWRAMRTCGDWVFYLNLIRGGLLAYSPGTVNYYRQHPANTSTGSFAQDRYYREHQEVAKTVQRHYRVDPAVFARQRQDLALHWTRHRGGLNAAGLVACYDLAAILAEAEKRKPNLLMASYAFAAGGGETFPVMLANLMKAAGFTVTFLNCDQEPAQPGIRAQLAPDIPVLTDFEDLNAILRDFDIDIVHSHHAWVDNTVLDHLPEGSPVKTVITLHGMYETILESQLKRMLPRLVQRTAKMVYVAEKNTEAMVNTGGMARGALVRIDNALPRGAGQPVPRADLGIPATAFVLTVVSRGMAEKGWQEAMAAVGRARALGGQDIRLIVVGDGPEYLRLSPNAPDYVHFVGFRANTRDYFAAADLGFLPSRFKGESFPLVLIDCLNAGRPVLASDLGEIAAMLTGPDGMAGEVFALQDWQVPIDAVAARIAALAADPAAMAELAARVPAACQKFDPDRMAAAYAAVYLAAVAG